MGERVTIAVEDHVAVVTLNRPDKRNALDLAMFEALGAAGSRLAADASVRACVLEGAGPHFCAGIDLGLFQGGLPAEFAAAMAPAPGSIANLFQRAAWAWREVPVPVICAVTGIAFGGGLQVALGADIRYAAPDARFSIMEVEWGLVPDMALSRTLPARAFTDRVRELAYTGRVFAAEEAAALGIVTAVRDDPAGAARELAAEIAGRSPDAVRAIKRLFDEAPALAPADALRLEASLQQQLLGAPNQQEAVTAKLERRQPRFTDPVLPE